MGKKKKSEVDTEMRSLLAEEVQEAAQKLAGLVEKRRHLKAKAKADAKAIKAEIEEAEEEIERLSRVVITQQEEVAVHRIDPQMTLAEIEDRRRHEVSIEQFNQETHAFDLGKQEEAAEAAATPGVCRVCGCSELNACVDPVSGPCAWGDLDETICTSCTGFMEERGIDEATLRMQLQAEALDAASEVTDEARKCEECGAVLPFDCITELCDSCLDKAVEAPAGDDEPAVYGSARDLAEFKAGLAEPTDSDLFKLQIQLANHASDRPYYEAVLDERLRREELETKEPQELASAPDPPDRNTVAGGLYAALHSFAEASNRWHQHRLMGATDAQLKQAIGKEFGLSGSQSGPGLKSVSYKGGKDPAFWFDVGPPAKPTLKGKVLIAEVREVLAIPEPQPVVIHNFDLVPHDPHKRNWSSLSDLELGRWRKDLSHMKGAVAADWLKRVELEMDLRDRIEELAADAGFTLPSELQQPRSTYDDALRMAEAIKAEQARRLEPKADAAGGD